MPAPMEMTTHLKTSRYPLAAVLAAFVLLAAAAVPVSANGLGRLFTTPQERQKLNELRDAKGDVPVDVPAVKQSQETGETEVPVQDPIMVKGVVIRDSGPAAAWINESNTIEGDLAAEYLQVKPGDIQSESVRLPATGTRRLFGPDEAILIPVKVGQTLEPATGRVIDLTDKPEPPVDPASAPGATAGQK